MPVTLASLASTPYRIGSPGNISVPKDPPAVGAAPWPAGTAIKYRNIHTVYPTAAGTITMALTPPTVQMALTTVAGTKDPNGDAIYLKYFDDEITSIRLPCPAPAGLNLFFTDNLSGCKFYVDTINGSNDLIVYHANTHQHTAGGAANADFQNPAAAAILDALHNAAQADYAPLVLNQVATCAMPTYFLSAGNEERRKALQGRTNAITGTGAPKFLGLCSIFGFPVGNSWQFWFQTCGDVSYQRPGGKLDALAGGHFKTAYKLATEGKKHAASYTSMKVFDYQQIY